MSLMKLLSVSNSFLAGKTESGRYRMTELGGLPKFAPVGRPVSLAPKRNPDGSIAHGELVPAQAKSIAVAEENPAGMLSLRQSCDRHSPFAEAAGEARAAATVREPRGAVCVNAVPESTNWFRLRKGASSGVPDGKVESKPFVQGEFSLDAVKPVRNDLSDADFEVVPARPGSGPGATKPPRPRLFKPELAGLAWSRLTARLFNTDRASV